MLIAHRFLTSIRKINDVLSIVRYKDNLVKCLNLMNITKCGVYEINIPEYKRKEVHHVIDQCIKLGFMNKDLRSATNDSLIKAIQVCDYIQSNAKKWLTKKFDEDSDLAIYIKCHLVQSSELGGDNLYSLVENLLEPYECYHPPEKIIEEVGEAAVNILLEFFEPKLLNKKFDDDIEIHIGWHQPQPIFIEVSPSMMILPSGKSDEEMEAFFKQYADVIYLKKVKE